MEGSGLREAAWREHASADYKGKDGVRRTVTYVTQEWNEWTEPYGVDIWFKTLDGEWQWGRIDNDDTRWRKSSIQHDTGRNTIRIYRDNELEAELFLDSFALDLGGKSKRNLGPHEGEIPDFLSGT